MLCVHLALTSSLVVEPHVDPVEPISPHVGIVGVATIPVDNAALLGGSSAIAWIGGDEYYVGVEELWKTRAEWEPRYYRTKLHFDAPGVGVGHVEVLKTVVLPAEEPTDGHRFKIEAAALGPNGELWMASEMNSGNQIDVGSGKGNNFLSRSFGHKDLGMMDRPRASRIARVNNNTGAVLHEVALPPEMLWDGQWYWDSSQCHGTRHLAGLESLCFSRDFSHAITLNQNAFYQDGDKPTATHGSHVRFNFWRHHANGTLTYERSHRYEASRIRDAPAVSTANQHNAVVAVEALSDTHYLVLEEQEVADPTRPDGRRSSSQLFLVIIPANESVDGCASLLDCDVQVPKKLLLFRSEGVADDMTYGPDVTAQDGSTRRSLVLCYDSDFEYDSVFLKLSLDEAALLRITNISDAEAYVNNDEDAGKLLSRRRASLYGASGGFLVLVALMWIAWMWSERGQADEKADLGGSVALRAYAKWSCIFNSFLLGGVVFGFPSAVLMFRERGIFAADCACGTNCQTQKEAFALVSVLGFSCNIGCRLLWGKVLDTCGPKITSFLTGFLCTVGFSLLAAATSEGYDAALMPGWCLMAAAGGGMHMAGFQVSNLYAKSKRLKRKASAALSAGFGGGSIIFPLLQLLSQFGGVPVGSIFVAYAVVAGCLTVNALFAAPWKPYTPGAPAEVSFAIWRAAWWRSAAAPAAAAKSTRTANADTQKPTPPSLLSQLCTWDFFWETSHFSANYLLNTFYLSSLNQMMYFKGDVKFTAEVNSWDDFMYRRAGSLYNGLGFVFLPVIATMMAKCSFEAAFAVESLLGLFICAILLVEVLEVQVLAFAMQSCFRLMLFGFHYAYIPDRFGFSNFGTLNGISALIAAIVGFAVYPLQLYANYEHDGDFGPSILITMGCCAVTGIVASTLSITRRGASADVKAVVTVATPKATGNAEHEDDVKSPLSPKKVQAASASLEDVEIGREL